MRSYIKKAIAIVLAAVLFAELPMGDYKPEAKAATEQALGTTAASEAATGGSADLNTDGNYTYISELRLFKAGDNREAVLSKARNEGWTIASEGEAPYDLNQFTQRDDIFLGYKTSGKKEDAITDVRMLEMDHGYEWFDYQTIAESQMDKIDVLAADLGVASVEFKNNLKAGSQAAQYAKDYLNYLYFTDSTRDEGTRHNLGDYMASGETDQKTLKKMIIRMNGGSLTLHFMPYNNGTAIDMRYTVVQAFGARYQKHADDVLIFVNAILGAQAQPIQIDINQFLAYEAGVPSAPMNAAGQPIQQYAQTFQQQAPQPAQPVQQAQHAPQARFCVNCGKPISPNAAFCTNCGKKLN